MSPPPRELRILFQRSGNRCAFPGCSKELVYSGNGHDSHVVLSEVAHIVGQSQEGPRGNYPLNISERDRYENLILLCEEHHHIIDTQVNTYTVERLRQMKANHEALIASVTSIAVTSRAGGDSSLELITETVYSTLLPVLRMPRYVYGVACSFDDSQEKLAAKEIKSPLDPSEMCPFIIRGGMLYCFNNLSDLRGPFRHLVGNQIPSRYLARDWWEDENKRVWFVSLLNRSLNKLTGRKKLFLDKQHRRYFFQAEEPNKQMEITYRPLNQSQTSRFVVWNPENARTGEKRDYWYHLAVALKFHKVAADMWCLSIRPEMYVSKDGVVSLESEDIGSRVTHKKSRMFNYDLLVQIQFWRDFLGDSKPRIVFPFGKGQHMIISTKLMESEINWPGIPEEFKKPFKNVEYEEDLFTISEASSLDEEMTDEDDYDWGEAEEDEV